MRVPRVPALDPPFQQSLEVVNVVVIPQVEILLAEAAPEAFDEGPGPPAT